VKNHLTFSGGANPAARLMLTMLGAFAEFERELMPERQREGIAIAKAKGVYRGRRKRWDPKEQTSWSRKLTQTFPRRTVRERTVSVGRRCTNTCGNPNQVRHLHRLPAREHALAGLASVSDRPFSVTRPTRPIV
jgi:hypothetical protein